MCPQMEYANEVFYSSVTRRKYSVLFHDSKTLDCTTRNVIYLITCTRCKMQYVGETQQQFSIRMSNHRSNIGSKASTLLYNHFNGLCTIEHFRAQPIETCPSKDLKSSTSKFLLDREAYWMKELRTIFPYGLNDRCKGKDFTKKKDLRDVTATVFNKIPVPRKKRGSGKNRWSSNFNIDKFLRDVVETYKREKNWIFFARKMITSLSKRTLKKLGLRAREYLSNSTAPSSILKVIQDLVVSSFHFMVKTLK